MPRNLGGARQGVGLAARLQGALQRRERSAFRFPGGVVGVAALDLHQLVLFQPGGERRLDGGAVSGHDAGRREAHGTGEPGEGASLRRAAGASFLLDQGLLEVARRDADVLAQREHFVARQSVPHVLRLRLQLRGALDDALQRLAGDQLPGHPRP